MLIHERSIKDHSRFDFDLLSPSSRPRYSVREGGLDDIEHMCTLIDRHVPGPVASAGVIQSVIAKNRNALSVFTQKNVVLGFNARLLLNAHGLERLLLGELNTLDPDEASLAEQDAAPAAIYLWMTIAPGLVVEGMHTVAKEMRDPLFAQSNLFSRAVTNDGKRLLEAFGFHKVEIGGPNLYRYVRHINRSSLQ